MKNKKGFTFVELLAVITIIGVLALILLPTIEKIKKTNNEKVYQQQLDNIVLSLKSWASDNRIYLPEKENGVLTITLGNLKADGYIEYEVKNPLTDKCFDNGMALIIKKIKRNYDYSIDLSTIKESDNCEFNLDSPVIALNGNMVEYVEVNSIYVDKGVIAKDKDGNDITGNVAVVITGSGNAVDTSRIGNQYIITYSVTDNDITAQLSRTIKIVDTKAPELIIPSDVAIESSVTSLDLMEGVSATDNSGENIEVTTKGNVDFGVVGKYTITYTAKDSSDNINSKKRTITINKVVNGIMSADSSCIKNIGSICPNGTLVSVQVNATQTYNFYVIKDTGTKLTLIMDRNLGAGVAWYAPSKYNNYGPITAITALNNRTKTWININPVFEYSYVNNQGGTVKTYGYQQLTIENGTTTIMAKDGTETTIAGVSRARIISEEELHLLINENSNVTPSWLYNYLDWDDDDTTYLQGYWTLTSSTASDYEEHDAYVMNAAGNLNSNSYVPYGGYNGIRPIIELSK